MASHIILFHTKQKRSSRRTGNTFTRGQSKYQGLLSRQASCHCPTSLSQNYIVLPFSLLKEALGITLLHLHKKKNAGCKCCRQGSAWAASSFSLWDKICVIRGLLFWLHPLNIGHKFASTATLTLRSPGLQQTMRNIKWEEGIGEILEAYSELSSQLHCKTCTTH